ncbi:MAG: DUF4245 domain-containing protein [Candidatus Nanopelagicales bacterium]
MSYKKPSYKKTVFDITISMALVGLFVVLLAGFVGQTRKVNEVEIRAIDLNAVSRATSQRTDLPIYAPENLPDGWLATSGRLEQIQNQPMWRFGLVTADEEFVGVKVSASKPERMLSASGYEITSSEIQIIDGKTMTLWTDQAKDESGIYYQAEGVNLLIYGTASFEEQLRLIENLKLIS